MQKPICAFHTAKLQTFPHPARVLAKKNLFTKKNAGGVKLLMLKFARLGIIR